MQGMILAAGVGSRLSPITGVVPKPMVPVADKPAMEHILEMLVRAGITNVKANLHHLPHFIEEHFGDGSRWGARLSYSLESRLLGTAGAVKRVERFFDGTFVVTVGDGLWDLDLREVLEFHRARGAAATIVVKPIPPQDVSRFGVVRVDEEGRILQFQEKPRPEEACSNLVSVGIYVLEPAMLGLVPAGEFFDFARDLFPRILELGLPFFTYRYEGPWSDIGTFTEYAQVHRDILGGAYTRLVIPGKEVRPGICIGHHSTIHPEAVIRGPVLIGSHCHIQRGAVVGPNTVVGSHCVIGEGARVTESIIAEESYVGRAMELEQCLVRGPWLVKLPTGTGVYMTDRTLLGSIRSQTPARATGRALDVALAGAGLAASAPLLLGMAAAGRATRQAVLERSPRLVPDLGAVTPAGTPRMRPFHLLRFSTQGSMGRVAERLGITHLPALYNVVRGDISLVGTKPLTEEEAARVPEEWRSHLHRVSAGLTGVWRTHGGEKAPLDEVLVLDAFYAGSKTLRGDLGLLWQTATRRFGRHSRQGRGHGMVIESRQEMGVAIVHPTGRLDARFAGLLRQRLKRSIDEGTSRIVVDLRQVEFIDSAGLAVLVSGMKMARAHSGDLRLAGLQAPVRLVFEITRLHHAFDLYEEPADAVAAFVRAAERAAAVPESQAA